MNDNELSMWTIHQHPRDFPQNYVVRRCRVVPGNSEPVHDPAPTAVVVTIEEARAALPPGLCRLPRFAEDDPVILEVWL